MVKRMVKQNKSLHTYRLLRSKYYQELQIDVIDIAYIRKWLEKTSTFRTDFYCLLLISDEFGEVSVNEQTINICRDNTIC